MLRQSTVGVQFRPARPAPIRTGAGPHDLSAPHLDGHPVMAQRRVGLWLIGACGGVGSTTALGLQSLARGMAAPTGLVTALPAFETLDLDSYDSFVVGGHDIR